MHDFEGSGLGGSGGGRSCLDVVSVPCMIVIFNVDDAADDDERISCNVDAHQCHA